jgi:hypothetical protein
MPEMVQQGVTGFVVPPEDNAALAAQLEQLLGDDELRMRTGKQARSWAAQNRSLDGMAAGTLMAYHKAVALQKGRRGYISDRSWRKGAVSSRLPDAFHPADVLELMMPGDPLALALREGLPQNYSVPDAQMVIGE